MELWIEKVKLEDIKKIHSEINQYINHSFLLTTAAIATFGVGIGWIVSVLVKSGKEDGAGGDMDLVFLASSVLFLLLACFSAGSSLIENNLQLLVDYLRARENWSELERDFAKLRDTEESLPFREEKYFRRWTLRILCVLTPGVPFLIEWAAKFRNVHGCSVAIKVIHLSICLFLWVLLVWFHGCCRSYRSKMKPEWERILNAKPEAPGHANAASVKMPITPKHSNTMDETKLLDTIRSEIQAEHTLFYQRMHWHGASQSFLVAAYAIAWKDSHTGAVWDFFRFGIPILGIILLAIGLLGIVAAVWVQARAMNTQSGLVDKMIADCDASGDADGAAVMRSYRETTFGGRDDIGQLLHWCAVLPPCLIPVLFFVTWVCLLLCAA